MVVVVIVVVAFAVVAKMLENCEHMLFNRIFWPLEEYIFRSGCFNDQTGLNGCVFISVLCSMGLVQS